MKFFIKKLNSNESGYSGDKPNQRGKFILIPKTCYEFFPDHSAAYLNDITLVELITPQGKSILRKYDWHNAKHHLGNRPDLNRGHDEKRLYRSNALDDSLGLDRNIFFICSKIDGKYYCFSINKSENLYEHLFLTYKTPCITEDRKIDDHFDLIFRNVTIENENIIEEDLFRAFSEPEPKTLTKDLILSESQFRELVMKAYDYKCALREDSIVYGDKIILQAAHIKPKRLPIYGPNIPSNGLALSYDLHRMFDEGMWTLSDDLSVIVHPKIIEQEFLGKFHKKNVVTKISGNFFQPDLEFLKFHREEEYGKFDLRN